MLVFVVMIGRSYVSVCSDERLAYHFCVNLLTYVIILLKCTACFVNTGF